MLAHIEAKYPDSGSHVDFANKKPLAQLNGLHTEEELREMLKAINHYSVDAEICFAAALTDRLFGFVERGNWTRMNVLYTKIVNKVLFGHKDGSWVEGEVVGLWSEICKFKECCSKKFEPHCSFHSSTLKFYLLDFLVDSLERFECFSYRVLTKYRFRMFVSQ